MPHVPFNACNDRLFHLLNGYDSFLLWKVQLSTWCKRTPGESHPLKFIARHGGYGFHDGVADEIVVCFFTHHNQVMGIKMETVFFWKIRKIENTYLAGCGVA